MRKTRSQTQAENANLTSQRQHAYTEAEFQEVRNMLMLFRVYELQRLLISLNLQHGGRKVDLQNRLLDLLQTNFKEISSKIREIYRTCASLDGRDSPLEHNIQNSARMYQQQMQMPVQSDVRNAATLIGNNIVVPFTQNMPHVPIHPDVRLKKLAFYDVLATLIQPSTLVPNNQQRTQEAGFYFTLTPQQATDIASNRDMRNGSKAEYTIQVQMRFCLLETSCEQEDCFPSSVMVKVNNKPCPLPNPIPTNRPNVEPKRPPRPVNVTANVKLSPTVTNNITVQWNPDFSRAYCISVYLVRKLTSTQLLNRMKSKGVKPADYTRGLIKEKLNEDADCEIATTMLRVSLICPLGKMRMSIPCRASTCSHLQCFDASLFLQMNERKPTWNCPVCDKPAIYETLVIDGYFQEVLASSLLTTDDTEIQLHKDGSWSTLQMRTESQVLDTPNKTQQKVEVISDDLEVITTEPDIKTDAKAIEPTPTQTIDQPPSTQNEPTSTTNSEMIDLTISDSDDDAPLKAKTPQKTTTNSTTATATQKQLITINSKSNNNDNLTSSIISLDSPSPPASPNADSGIENGSTNSTCVSSTTTVTPYCSLPSHLDAGNMPNYQINPMAVNSRNVTSRKRKVESIEKRRLKLKKKREAAKKRRKNETTEHRQKRLQTRRGRPRPSQRKEKLEERERRLIAHKKSQSPRCQKETPKKRNLRVTYARESQLRHYKQEQHEDRRRRLLSLLKAQRRCHN